MKRTILIGAMLAMLTCPMVADEAEPAYISADAAWVVHFDVDAWGETKLEQAILDQHPEAIPKLEEFRATFGFDLREDLHGVTLYGTGFEPGRGVAMFDADVDRDRILDLLRENAGYETSEYGDRTIHRWIEESKPRHGEEDDGTRYGAFAAFDLVVVSRDLDDLKAALDVIDGEADSAADAEEPVLPEAPDGAFLIARARDLELPEGARRPRAALLKKCEELSVTLGEKDAQVYVNIAAEMETEKDARRVTKMIEGMQAFAEMAAEHARAGAEDDDGEPAKTLPVWMSSLMEAEMSGEGTKVVLEMSMPTEGLMEMAEKVREAHHGRRHEAGERE